MFTVKFRAAVFALTYLFMSHNMVFAQDVSWAQKMFDKKIFEKSKLDLGVVARGADFQFNIVIKNIYKEDVHVSHVKTTCGCTGATIEKKSLKTHEKTAVKVTLNTRKFMRRKDTNVIITFDKPLYAVVRIPLTFYIRTDVVLTPGSVEFGDLDKGQKSVKVINIAYSGRPEWTIRNIKNKNPNIDFKIEQVSRIGRNINYKLICTLKSTAPVGRINQQITLVTDDASNPYVPVMVKGNIETDIAVTPLVKNLGKMEPGKEKKFRVIFKGKKSFSITSIECDSVHEDFKMMLPEGKKKVFAVPFSFTAPDRVGKFSENFTINIDGRDEPLVFTAVGEIKIKN